MQGSSSASLQTLGELADRLKRFGEAPAVARVQSGEMRFLTSAELCAKAAGLASGLAHMGVGRGEVVALIAPNSPAYVAILLGIVLCGATVMPLDPQLDHAELERMLAANRCRVAFLNPALMKALPSATAKHRFVVSPDDTASDDWTSLLDAKAAPLPSLETTDVAVLVYTSGTTGTPKAVPLTHGNITACINGLMAEDLVKPGDRALVPLPIHHVYPLVVGTLSPLAAGASVVFPESLTGPDLRRAMRLSRATHLIGVPRLYHAMVEALTAMARGHWTGLPLIALLRPSTWLTRRTGWRVGAPLFFWLRWRIAPRLRILISGGAALDPELQWTLRALGWEVLIGYGLSETGPILAFTRRRDARVGTVGRALDGVTLRISQPDAQGVGEIEARGPNVFSGYRDNPAATSRAFTEDGWFRTGDLGALDRDGHLRIVARLAEVIVLPGGRKIDPELLEEAYRNSPLIREIGLFMKDGALLAVIVPNLAEFGTGGHTQIYEALQRAIAGLGASLPSYQRLSGFAVSREPLPRTPVGKIRRHLLPELYQRLREGRPIAPSLPLSPEDEAILREPAAHKLWTWLQARYPDRAISLDSHPQLDLGIDSLGWIGLTLEIEQTVGIAIDEPTLARVTSVRDLLKAAVASADRAPAAGTTVRAQALRALSPDWTTLILRRLLIGLDRILMRLVFSLAVKGAENLPANGPYLICPNHASYLDPFALAAALPPRLQRNLCWTAWTGVLFTTPLRRLLSRIMGVLPVDPAQPAQSLALVTAAVEADKITVWFPEGARSPDGTLQPFPAGTGYLVRESAVPVVPVFIAGTYGAWPVRRRWPRPAAVSVTFGRLIDPAELGDRGTNPQDIADRLRERIATLAANAPHPA